MTKRSNAIYNARRAYGLLIQNGVKDERLTSCRNGYFWQDENGYKVVLTDSGTVNATQTKSENDRKG